MPEVSRYHPMLVALHWLLAFLIIAALALGALIMAKLPNSDPMKLEALRSHMFGGWLDFFANAGAVVCANAHRASTAGGDRSLDARQNRTGIASAVLRTRHRHGRKRRDHGAASWIV